MHKKEANSKFKKLCKDIKDLKIQGAENVAKAAVKALLYKHDQRSIKKLISLRPTEPCLYNSIKFVLSYDDLKEGINKALSHFEYAQHKIAEIGSKLIENNFTVYTHCHSSSVINILLKAKNDGKKFNVVCTETRPLFQGRITAKELSEANIPVKIYIDSAARVALKQADIAFFGCDAITTTKIYNKIGSEMFAIISKQLDVPLYVATDSWKFDAKSIYGQDREIEYRAKEEIWKNAPKKILIENPAFEKIDPQLVTGILSELGLFMNKSFIMAVKKNYPFIFKEPFF